jgi:hypothetical protein
MAKLTKHTRAHHATSAYLCPCNHAKLCASGRSAAVEAQAVSRVLRIGQTKETHVYRLIVRGTIEEQILQMQQCNTGGGGGGGGDDAADGRSSGADGAVTSSTGLVSTLDAPPPRRRHRGRRRGKQDELTVADLRR